jgi:hypothetical protein
MRGLDPRIHLKKKFSRLIDCQVKPGNDDKEISRLCDKVGPT